MEDRPYITCRELIEFLDRYLSGELPPDRVLEFERHLAVCPACVAYVASYRETVELGKRLVTDTEARADDSVPDDLVRAVLRAVRPR